MKFGAFLLVLLLGGAGGWFLRGSKEAGAAPLMRGSVAQVQVDRRPIQRGPNTDASFAGVISNAAPGVVNIFTSRNVQPEMDSPFGDLFRMPRRGRGYRAQSLGSGVIITKDGFILTNNHVVDQADEINVSFADDTRTFTARVVGTDPPTDLAVIKIDAEDLPALTVADSDNLSVGDVVLAIGNPYGVGQSVTMGIVGAIGRGGFGIVDYEDFIQTDASINPGNSGGALIDAEGRLVGINTAILSPTGGNQGIGFAVPINMAQAVMEEIIRRGRVVRGYLGVALQDNTAEVARALRLPNAGGALVVAVAPDSPAVQADLREGDVIVGFNGTKVNDSRQLRLLSAQTDPKSTVTLQVRRNGKEASVQVTLGEMPEVPVRQRLR